MRTIVRFPTDWHEWPADQQDEFKDFRQKYGIIALGPISMQRGHTQQSRIMLCELCAFRTHRQTNREPIILTLLLCRVGDVLKLICETMGDTPVLTRIYQLLTQQLAQYTAQPDPVRGWQDIEAVRLGRLISVCVCFAFFAF